jgi:hypothetical protein
MMNHPFNYDTFPIEMRMVLYDGNFYDVKMNRCYGIPMRNR